MKHKSELKLEDRILHDLSTYAGAMASYVESGSKEYRTEAVGVLKYLVEEDDLVSDDVPVIGFLDDMLALVTVAREIALALELSDRVGEFGVPLAQAQYDWEYYDSKKGLMMSNTTIPSMTGIKSLGDRVGSDEIPDLIEKARTEISGN